MGADNGPAVLVLGSVTMDLVSSVSRAPRPGETVLGEAFRMTPGGKGANQAVAAARLGARVRMAGAVGKDVFGEKLRAALDEEGIDASLVRTVEDAAAGTAVILVEQSGQNSIVVNPGANFAFSPDDAAQLEDAIAKSDVLLLQLETPMETVESALRAAKRNGVRSILDAGPARAIPGEVLGLCSIVSPNETEAEAIAGVPVRTAADAGKAAEAIRRLGADEVVVKLGAQGCGWLKGDAWRHVPAFQVKAVDSVAAGDAFTAALAVRTAEGASMEEALVFANAAGALAATRPGAQESMPRREEVARLVREGARDRTRGAHETES